MTSKGSCQTFTGATNSWRRGRQHAHSSTAYAHPPHPRARVRAAPPRARFHGAPAATVAQGSSKSWSDVSQRIIKRQRAAIEKLKADNGALKHELALEVRQRAGGFPRRGAGTARA